MGEQKKRGGAVRAGVGILCLGFLLAALSGCGKSAPETVTGSETVRSETSPAKTETGGPEKPAAGTGSPAFYEGKRWDAGICCNEDLMIDGTGDIIYTAETGKETEAESDRMTKTWRILSRTDGTGEGQELYRCREELWTYGKQISGETVLGLTACDDGSVAILTRNMDAAGNETCFLKQIEPTGAVRNEIKLPEGASPGGDLFETENGLAWTDYEEGILVWRNGQESGEALGSVGAVRAAGTLRDRTVWAKVSVGEAPSAWKLYRWDTKNGDWAEIKIPFSKSYYPEIASGRRCGYDFLLWNSSEAAGWNVGDAEPTRLMDFLLLDIRYDEIDRLVPLGKERFLSELEELKEAYPDSTVLSPYILRDEYLLMLIGSGRFTDRKTGECTFDSEEFIRLLRFAGTLPAAADWTVQQWPQTRYDRILITRDSINSFYSFQDTEERKYGAEAAFFTLGIPGGG